MEKIEHKYIEANGSKLHVAELGSGSTSILFLHGFPEIWYTWRYQMTAVAEAGYRAIAIDFRGYGLSDPKPVPENTTYADIMSDLLALLDALGIEKVVLIAKDFGAFPAYRFTLLHPTRVSGVITLGVVFTPPGPSTFHIDLPEGFYVNRWQEPGRAEADFGRFDAKTVVRNIYILFSKSDIPIAAENQEILDLVEPSTLPPWFSEEDLAVYGSLYEKSGFRTALKVPYRSFSEVLNISNPKIDVPAMLIMGEKDYVLKIPGVEDYIRSGKVKQYFAPNYEIIFLPEGTHFAPEQLPEQVNQLILAFLGKHNY